MLVRTLYAEHAGPLLRYAMHLTSGDRQRAEDIVQETLLRAWMHPDAIADRPARPWLFAVARNLAVDAYRAGFLAAVAAGFGLERAAQLGNLIAACALETVGPQEYEFKPEPLTARFAAAYGDEAASDLASLLDA